jgi:phosphate:Na+ symporter
MQYSIIPLLFGLFVMIFAKKSKTKNLASVVMYFGILFFGMLTIQESVLPLADSEMFTKWMTKIESNPIQGALIGGLITLIIQSSGATVGMAIILGKQKMLTVVGGLYQPKFEFYYIRTKN